MRRLFFSALSLLAPACCEVKGPCIPWAKVGETYQMELVQHFENPQGTTGPVAYYTSQERTCGMGLDLDVGSAIQMKAMKSNGVDWESCACNDFEAKAGVSHLRWMNHATFGRSIGTSYFLDQGRVVIGSGCTGIYTIGIDPVPPAFIHTPDGQIATDYILFRTLSVTGDVGPCLALGSELARSKAQTCGDAWAVRIRDSSGHILTRDLPTAVGKILPKDAGLQMDSGS
jgi:hypothetical protein